MNKDFKILTPFKLMLKNNFPFIEYDFDALTNYELLCQVVKYLNDVIGEQNKVTESQQALIDAFNQLKNYVDNLDLQDEVNNKIDTMIADGTFDNILSNYSIGKDTFRSRLYLSKIGRLNLTSYVNNGYVGGGQAGVYIGNNSYVFTIIKNDSTGNARVLNLDLHTGLILNYKDIDNMYHANGSCLKDDSIYFTQSFNNQNEKLDGIVEIDKNSLELKNIYNINFNGLDKNEIILSIGYNKILDKFILIASNYFYICDTSFNVESAIYMQMPISKNLIRQGGTVYNNYVCVVVNSENAIICYNIDGSIHHIIDFGYVQNSNVMGEIENISVYDNILYLNSNLAHVNASNLLIHQFFKASIIGGGLSQLNSNDRVFQTAINVNCIVNKSKYNTLSDIDKFKSDGTLERPYESIAEAVANLNTNFTNTINVQDTTDYNEQLAIYNRNLTLKGGNSKVRSVKVVNSRITISSLIFNHSDARGVMFGDLSQSYNSPLYITYGSIVTLVGNTGLVYDNCVQDGMQYRYINEGSILNDNSLTSTNLGISKFTNQDSSSGDIQPLIIYNGSVNTSSAYNIKSNNVRKSDLRNATPITNIANIQLSNLNGYTNIYKGLYVAINLPGKGNTDYHKICYYNPSRNVIFESLNEKYMFVIQYANENISITPYKYNNDTNSFQRNNDVQYYPYYEFDL